MREYIDFVLHHTSHPGNIGGAARAMKNMALTKLKLVAPLQFPHPSATERASGADDLLHNAQHFGTLESALADCQWVFGTSARTRAFPWPQLTPKQAALKIIQAAQNQQKVAVVFGNEQSGLSNEHLQLCDFHIAIPTNPDFASLNLASAVQVIAYETYQTQLDGMTGSAILEEKATADQVHGLLNHWVKIAETIGFLDPHNPRKLVPRIQKILMKATLTPEEVNVLRGFLKLIPE